MSPRNIDPRRLWRDCLRRWRASTPTRRHETRLHAAADHADLKRLMDVQRHDAASSWWPKG
ncbi:MAG: hypothetical protein ACJ8G7_07160 [Rhizobacter sp.]